jgi:hypothetical protein
MSIYDFRHDPSKQPPAPNDNREPAPAVPYRPFNIPDVSKRTKITYNDQNVDVIDTQDINVPGFRTMDEGMKRFLTGINIPTKDGMKKVEARIAGGDKSVLRWIQDYLKDGGRPKLPVISINRTGAEWNPQKFSPAYHPMRMRFLDSDGSRIKFVYRPQPYMIEYQISIWAERKRDAEYIQYDIMTRFNPLAVIEVGDEHINGPLTLSFNGMTDSSDIEMGADDVPKIRYDISISAEGWLPIPTSKIVPSVLGRVTTLNDEDTGDILESIDDV